MHVGSENKDTVSTEHPFVQEPKGWSVHNLPGSQIQGQHNTAKIAFSSPLGLDEGTD